MNWRWLKFNCVPPEIKLSIDERSELQQLIGRATSLRHKVWLLRLLYLLCFFIVWTPLIWWLRDIYGIDSTYSLFILLIGLLGYYVAALCFIMPGRKQVTYRCLRQMGYQICANCGDSMRGHGDGVMACPQCGWQREASDERKG